jgi:predicted ferric reductase
MHSLTKRRLRKTFWIVIPSIITLILWIWAKVHLEGMLQMSNTLRYFSQIFALLGIVLLAQNYLLSTRLRILEKYYGGLDKLYKTHDFIGKSAFLLIILHLLSLLLFYSNNYEIFITLIIPFISSGSVPKTFGILSLYSYVILIFFTIVKFLPYHIWKFTHSLIGIPFFFGAIHAFGAESDVKYFFPLQLWIGFWIFVGISSYIYKLLLYKYIGPKKLYSVTDIIDKGQKIYELHLEPKSHRLNYEPGEFVFVSFINNEWINSHSHPFTVSSSPHLENIRISFKEVGDYTSKLKLAQKGDLVNIYGSYGEFSSYVFSPYKKQIWIAGGIGITPFLSMLGYEVLNKDKKDINIYYSVRNKEELVYDNEINDLIKQSDDNIKHFRHTTSSDSRLSAAKIINDIGKDNIQQYLILMCGPDAMMRSLQKQFISHGISKDMIVFEEFNFR